MVDGRNSFVRYIMPYVLDKLRVAYTIILRKPFLDGSDLLSGKEDSKRVEEQVKCMFTH
jgi:hypothetical protein